MKAVKYILIIVVLVIASVLLVAAFIPSEFGVKRNVSINKSKVVVFEYVKLLKNQDNFSTWAMIDPNMEKHLVVLMEQLDLLPRGKAIIPMLVSANKKLQEWMTEKELIISCDFWNHLNLPHLHI